MAGYLDSKKQIIDMVLTNHGKLLLSQGELRFVYWAASDDGLSYNPVISQSGSMTVDQLAIAVDTKIQEPLQREVTTGYRNFNRLRQDRTSINNLLSTVPPGQDIVPEMVTGSIDSRSVSMLQTGIFRRFSNLVSWIGANRAGSTSLPIDADYTKQSFPQGFRMDGFYITVLASGTNGYSEQHHTFGRNGEIVIGPDLKIDTK